MYLDCTGQIKFIPILILCCTHSMFNGYGCESALLHVISKLPLDDENILYCLDVFRCVFRERWAWNHEISAMRDVCAVDRHSFQ